MISLLLPTRGRPHMLARLLASVERTAQSDVEVRVWVDTDDPVLEMYKIILKRAKANVVTTIGKAASVGHIWDELANRAQGDFLRMTNDDEHFVTEGWDVTLASAFCDHFPDNIGMVWADDSSEKKEKQCCFPMVHHRWLEILGHFCPTCFQFLYHDTWIEDIARKANRAAYVPTVVIEHKHYHDALYIAEHSNDVWGHDYKKFQETDPERAAYAQMLVEQMDADAK